MNSCKQLMLVISEMFSFFSQRFFATTVCTKRCWMYSVQTYTAALAGKCLSHLLLAVDHQGHLLYSFCVFVLLTQRCWLSDRIWLTEEEGVVATPYITFQSLNRTPWLPQLLWEGQSTPFLFPWHGPWCTKDFLLKNNFTISLCLYVNLTGVQGCRLAPDLLQTPWHFRGCPAPNTRYFIGCLADRSLRILSQNSEDIFSMILFIFFT